MEDYAEQRIRSLEDYIRNSVDKTTVDAVNANSFYSYRHANRLFKLLKGESINSFSNKFRIQTSAEYLKYSSQSILDIALLVGYESTAAFSKAFKKSYGQSPRSFRNTFKKTNNELIKGSEEFCYSIIFLDENDVYTKKVTVSSNITVEEIYSKTLTKFNQLNTSPDQFMMLWDEDPEVSQWSESHFLLGFDSIDSLDHDGFEISKIKGRYAIFDAAIFEGYSYETWHKLTYLILDIDGRKLRQDSYIEWFSNTSLQSLNTFRSFKMAIPIQ